MFECDEDAGLDGNSCGFDAIIYIFLDFLDDAFARDERRMRACIAYIVNTQYLRPKPAKVALCGAIEDVLLNGLTETEAAKIHKGIQEHVMSALLVEL